MNMLPIPHNWKINILVFPRMGSKYKLSALRMPGTKVPLVSPKARLANCLTTMSRSGPGNPDEAREGFHTWFGPVFEKMVQGPQLGSYCFISNIRKLSVDSDSLFYHRLRHLAFLPLCMYILWLCTS